MFSKPLIAITTSLDRGVRLHPGRDYLYVARAYSQRIAEAGGVPVLVSPDTCASAVAERCDGLVITGGEDLPERLPPYSSNGAPTTASSTAPSPTPASSTPANPTPAAPHLHTTNGSADGLSGFTLGEGGVAEDPERIAWDRAVLDAFDRAGKCVLGVCYGMQLLNVHFGGSLYLHVASAPELAVSPVAHGGSGVVTRHALRAEAPSRLWTTTPLPSHVNSSHRQGVRDVAPGFAVTSRSDDGLVESIEREHLFGLQWHPETDLDSRAAWTTWLTLCLR